MHTHEHTCMHSWVLGVCLNVGICERHKTHTGQKTTSGVAFHIQPYLIQGFWLFSTAHVRLSGPRVSGDSPISASHLVICVSTWSEDTHYSIQLYMTSGDLNSGLHAYIANILPTKSFPLPFQYVLRRRKVREWEQFVMRLQLIHSRKTLNSILKHILMTKKNRKLSSC